MWLSVVGEGDILNLPVHIATMNHVPGPPSAPRDVRESNVTNTSAVLSWLPPEDDGGRDRSEIHYTVKAAGKSIFASLILV